jgi:hypothetical protein
LFSGTSGTRLLSLRLKTYRFSPQLSDSRPRQLSRHCPTPLLRYSGHTEPARWSSNDAIKQGKQVARYLPSHGPALAPPSSLLAPVMRAQPTLLYGRCTDCTKSKTLSHQTHWGPVQLCKSRHRRHQRLRSTNALTAHSSAFSRYNLTYCCACKSISQA